MGAFEQLATDDDRTAAEQLAKYLIETEGNRFYGKDLATVREHIAGQASLLAEAHKFQQKFAALMQHDPVQQMMKRYEDPAAKRDFMARIERLQQQRAQKKLH